MRIFLFNICVSYRGVLINDSWQYFWKKNTKVEYIYELPSSVNKEQYDAQLVFGLITYFCLMFREVFLYTFNYVVFCHYYIFILNPTTPERR